LSREDGRVATERSRPIARYVPDMTRRSDAMEVPVASRYDRPMTERLEDLDHPIMRQLRPGETVMAVISATRTHVVVTDHRIAVAEADRIALDMAIDELRRIQFDIERNRPATLVIVPEHPRHEPQVLAIPPEHFGEVGEALDYIGRRLYARKAG
jgi:hypothetical protein